MAPRVNQAQRRAQVVDAMWRVISRDGFGAVSVRSVAAEAGLPKTAITKVFTGRTEMLICAVDLTTSEILTRQASRMDATVTRQSLVVAMMEAIPSTPRRREHATAWVGLLEAAAGGDKQAAAALIRLNAAMGNAVEAHIEKAKQVGLIAATRNTRRTVAYAMAIIDGLSIQSVTNPGAVGDKAIKACIEDYVNAITSG